MSSCGKPCAGRSRKFFPSLSKATVIVTHDQLEALTMADRVAIMREGVIEQMATPHEIFARPDNVFVASFIGTPQMNLIEARLERVSNGKATLNIGSNKVKLDVGRAVAGMPAGTTTVGIRPRAFTPVAKPEPDTITVSAELIEPMGPETLIHARADGGLEIRVVVPREHKIRMGEVMHLRPDPVQTHIFDRNGKAVRS